jgi:hypothetical protein
VIFNQSRQWWGERPEGVAATVSMAHEQGLKVMLKPQIYIPGHYTGHFTLGSDTDWQTWETGYQDYIISYAKLADSLQVELFCFGTEWCKAMEARPGFWLQLADSVRAVYRGKLTYAANWDDYENCPIWAKMDYVGINAYFPLDAAETPDTTTLIRAWQPHIRAMEEFVAKSGKPILFTEYGYLSVSQCAWRNWELEKNIEERTVNQVAQANALDALWAALSGKSWWAGGFLWKWFPEGQGHEGYPERDYTPQNKAGEAVLKKHFSN